jgi:hypothetical protein
MRRIVREQLGADAAHANRDKAAPLNVIAVEADDGEGATVSKAFTRRRLLTVLQELADTSRQEGEPLYFGIEEVAGVLTFVVRPDQWGANRTTTAVLSPEFGNLTNVVREWDYAERATVCYALGGGEGISRAVQSVEDTTATGENDYYFIEEIFDNANETNTAGLLDDARALLTNRRAITRFSGEIQETEGFMYGTNWNHGDRLKAEFLGEEFTVWLNLVQVNASAGRETINARLEVVA